MKYGFLEELFRFGGAQTIAVADSASGTTATEEQTGAALITLTGTITALRVVTLQARNAGALWAVANDCTFPVKVQLPTGASVSIPPKKKRLVVWTGAAMSVVGHEDGSGPLVYSASIAVDASTGSYFKVTATNGSAFTIQSPTSMYTGQQITFDILNSSGGALGAITWGGDFALAGSFTNPANTKRRTISFVYDGAKWVETGRAAADI